MLTRDYLNNMVKCLKAKFPKLNIDISLEDDADDPYYYSYTLYMNYSVKKDIFRISAAIFMDSANYTGNKAKVSNSTVDLECETATLPITDEKYFNTLKDKQIEGFNLVKDCISYFNDTYKKEVLKLLKEK